MDQLFGNHMKLLNKKYILIFLIIIVSLISIGVRIYKFNQMPQTLYIDEVAMLVDAKALVKTGNDMHGYNWFQAIFLSYGDYKLPVYIWLVYLSSLIFGVGNFAVRLPNLIAGILTMVFTVLILLKMYKNQINSKYEKYLLILAGIITIGLSPWAIHFSRVGFESYVGQLFLAISIYVLINSKNKILWLFSSAFFATLATYSYYSVRFIWIPIFILWFLLNIDFKQFKKKFRSHSFDFIKILLAIGLYLLLLLPMQKSPWYSASQQFRLSTPSVLRIDEQVIQSNQLVLATQGTGINTLNRVYFHRYHLILRNFLKNLSEQLSLNFIFLTGDSNLRHGTGNHGLFLFPFIISFLVGMYLLVKENFKQGVFLLSLIILSAVPASIPYEVPHALRFLNALVPLSIIISFGLFKIFTYKNMNYIYKSFLSLFILITIFSFVSYANYYYSIYPELSKQAWFDEEYLVAQKIIKYKNDNVNMILFDMPTKEYLWLMAYGNYDGSEFNRWKSDQFEFKNFDNIYQNLIEIDRKTIMFKDVNRKINLETKFLESFKVKNDLEYEVVELN